MSSSYSTGVSLGPAYTAQAVGYRLVDTAGSTVAAFTTSGVVEDTAIPGDYLVTGGVPLPDGFAGRVVWGLSGTPLVNEWVNPTAYQPAVSADPSGRVTLAPAGLDGVVIETGTNARQALAAVNASLAATAGLFVAGTVSAATGPNSFTVNFTAAVLASDLVNLLCCVQGADHRPAKATITGAVQVDSTHVVLAFNPPFANAPAVNDSVLVG